MLKGTDRHVRGFLKESEQVKSPVSIEIQKYLKISFPLLLLASLDSH